MLGGLKIRKSAGVRVTGSVHRLIQQGNGARGRGDWAAAADAYRAALAADPALYHIWIQLGHALGQVGQWAEADDAYAHAAGLRPGAAEPALHRGHLAKRKGDPVGAASAYLAGARLGDAETVDELHRLVRRLIPIDRASVAHAARHEPAAQSGPPMSSAAGALREIGRLLPAETSGFLALADRLDAIAAGAADEGGAAGPPMLFDVSDLIAHFRHRRLPTGIQRVQIEVVLRALAKDPGTRVCCFVDGREHLLEIAQPMFVELAHLSKAGKDEQAADWTDAIARLFIHLALVSPIEFRHGECLVNLGTSWWIYNYFLLIRNARASHGVRLIAFVHDVIPLMAPEHCVLGVIQDYVGWLVGAVQHTDLFLANSESTARDFRRAVARLGHDAEALPMEVVPLDADFRTGTAAPPDRSVLDRWDLGERPFALFVSTIESRKNHRLALDAWAALLREGHRGVPQLVCVGRNGWLNDPVFQRLAANAELKRRVTIIERVSDEELALLYRESLFTLYPSLYEGWGLPVTESLCYGKLPVVADNSSLPEAGGRFALFFESDSIDGLAAAVRRVIDDPAWREERERDIAAHFAPRSWTAIADQILAATARAAGLPERDAHRPLAPIGRFNRVTAYLGAEIWPGLASGERFRLGDGWLWPQPDGCRTRPGGGMLALTLPERTDGALRLYLRLKGLAEQDCPYRILIDGEEVRQGTLEPLADRWITPIILPAAARDRIEVGLHGLAEEAITMVTGGTPKSLAASIGVSGFFLCAEEDEAARHALMEAFALGDPDRIDATARPV